MEEVAIRERLVQSYTGYYRDMLGLPDWSYHVNKRVQLSYETHVAKRLADLVGDLTSKVIFDVGCGWGGTIVAIKRIFPDAVVFGLEPDWDRLELASKTAKFIPFAAVGERIPLPRLMPIGVKLYFLKWNYSINGQIYNSY